jgi:hypothetical protein
MTPFPKPETNSGLASCGRNLVRGVRHALNGRIAPANYPCLGQHFAGRQALPHKDFRPHAPDFILRWRVRHVLSFT